MPHAVLVSDFDGTMTAEDFYKLAAERLLPADALAAWAEYRAGRRTHFSALKTIFGRIRAPEAEVLALVRDMGLDPGLAAAVARLRQAGWEVVVASAGCAWYIRHLLAEAGVEMEVHANPGEYLPGGPLRMEMPADPRFSCPETGVDKAAVVRFHRERATRTAFAGDGFADLPAALEVPPGLRFARADLAQALDERGEQRRTFAAWSEVADALLGQGGEP